MITNPLYDKDFLEKLFSKKEREIYVRLTALSWQEKPIEYIEGRATGGNINIDGSSVVRRTCALTLIAKDLNIKDFYWGLKSKFKLEIGLKNTINDKYQDIVWFKQGIYIITSFSVSYSTNNYSISISGKDKMCLLNGDIAGVLPHTTDFGVEEYYDAEENTTTYTNVPIRRIIQESLQNFGNELPQNIIINDLEDAGLELLEYRGDIPLYLFREVNSDSFINMTINEKQKCYISKTGKQTTIDDSENIQYDNLVNLTEGEQPTKIKLTTKGKEYTIAKFEYGSIPGYRLTDLTYAGDLISNVGETLTSMLDKIKNMLGEFEYFYDLDGRFVFQKKQTYVDVAWNNIEKSDEIFTNAAINKSIPLWSFVDNQLITAIQNTPNLLNLRNDFAIWGKKKTTSGTELDIHMRYAIDEKPSQYYSLLDNKWYQTFGEDKVDWRELIYKMALDYRRFYHDDDFLTKLIKANTPEGETISLYPTGKTGYEQYYVDLEGFWRQLYNPNPQIDKYIETGFKEIIETDDVYIRGGLIKVNEDELQDIELNKLFIITTDNILKPFLNGYCYLELSDDGKYHYQYLGADGNWYSTMSLEKEYLLKMNLQDFYTETQEKIEKVFYQKALNENTPLYVFSDNRYYAFKELDNKIKKLYQIDGSFQEQLKYAEYNIFGEETEESRVYDNKYYIPYYGFQSNGWAKEVSDNPESLLFWFDFLDANESNLNCFSVKAVGTRAKALNDNDVKSIYYREIPQTIFQTGQEVYEHQTGYTYVQLQNTMENLFTISSKGKSAQERLEELLYQYSYCIQSTTLTTLPVYHLEPNTRISVKAQENDINGEYVVSKITIPLTYNGTMSLTATKIISNITE